MKEHRNSVGRAGRVRLKNPYRLVDAPLPCATSRTLAPRMYSPVAASVTRPLTVKVWPHIPRENAPAQIKRTACGKLTGNCGCDAMFKCGRQKYPVYLALTCQTMRKRQGLFCVSCGPRRLWWWRGVPSPRHWTTHASFGTTKAHRSRASIPQPPGVWSTCGWWINSTMGWSSWPPI